jgi:hypothetical protein
LRHATGGGKERGGGWVIKSGVRRTFVRTGSHERKQSIRQRQRRDRLRMMSEQRAARQGSALTITLDRMFPLGSLLLSPCLSSSLHLPPLRVESLKVTASATTFDSLRSFARSVQRVTPSLPPPFGSIQARERRKKPQANDNHRRFART